MGEVVSQRTLGPWAGRRRPIPPPMGWRGCDISIVISGVEELKLGTSWAGPSLEEVLSFSRLSRK